MSSASSSTQSPKQTGLRNQCFDILVLEGTAKRSSPNAPMTAFPHRPSPEQCSISGSTRGQPISVDMLSRQFLGSFLLQMTRRYTEDTALKGVGPRGSHGGTHCRDWGCRGHSTYVRKGAQRFTGTHGDTRMHGIREYTEEMGP